MGVHRAGRKGFAESLIAVIFKAHATFWGRHSSMNAPTDLSMKTDDVLKVELEVFRREHRDLDEAIRALQETGTADQLTLQRLKKKKLMLKDKIALIEDRLLPDIIA
ncbi:hypothetical protein CLV76_101501 [Marivita geojedonensis]|nr:hypothetical protein CLV76_101501 [Marivita geojedonensis]